MWLRIVKRFLMYLFNGRTNKENSLLGRVDSKPIVSPPPTLPTWSLLIRKHHNTVLQHSACFNIFAISCFPLCVKPELSMFPFWVRRLQDKLWRVLSSVCVRNPDYCKWAMSFVWEVAFVTWIGCSTNTVSDDGWPYQNQSEGKQTFR